MPSASSRCADSRFARLSDPALQRDEDHSPIRQPSRIPIHSKLDIGLLNPAEVGLHLFICRGFRDRVRGTQKLRPYRRTPFQRSVRSALSREGLAKKRK